MATFFPTAGAVDLQTLTRWLLLLNSYAAQIKWPHSNAVVTAFSCYSMQVCRGQNAARQPRTRCVSGQICQHCIMCNASVPCNGHMNVMNIFFVLQRKWQFLSLLLVFLLPPLSHNHPISLTSRSFSYSHYCYRRCCSQISSQCGC